MCVTYVWYHSLTAAEGTLTMQFFCLHSEFLLKKQLGHVFYSSEQYSCQTSSGWMSRRSRMRSKMQHAAVLYTEEVHYC